MAANMRQAFLPGANGAGPNPHNLVSEAKRDLDKLRERGAKVGRLNGDVALDLGNGLAPVKAAAVSVKQTRAQIRAVEEASKRHERKLLELEKEAKALLAEKGVTPQRLAKALPDATMKLCIEFTSVSIGTEKFSELVETTASQRKVTEPSAIAVAKPPAKSLAKRPGSGHPAPNPAPWASGTAHPPGGPQQRLLTPASIKYHIDGILRDTNIQVKAVQRRQRLAEEKAAAMENRIEELQEELQDARSLSTSLQTKMEDASETIAKLKDDNSFLQKELARQMQKRKDLSADNSLAETREQLSAAHDKIRDLQNLFADTRADSMALQKELDQMRSAMEERDTNVRSLSQLLMAAEADRSSLLDQLTQRETKIESLTAQVAQHKTAVADLEKSQAESNKTMTGLESKVRAVETNNKELALEVARQSDRSSAALDELNEAGIKFGKREAELTVSLEKSEIANKGLKADTDMAEAGSPHNDERVFCGSAAVPSVLAVRRCPGLPFGVAKAMPRAGATANLTDAQVSSLNQRLRERNAELDNLNSALKAKEEIGRVCREGETKDERLRKLERLEAREGNLEHDLKAARARADERDTECQNLASIVQDLQKKLAAAENDAKQHLQRWENGLTSVTRVLGMNCPLSLPSIDGWAPLARRLLETRYCHPARNTTLATLVAFEAWDDPFAPHPLAHPLGAEELMVALFAGALGGFLACILASASRLAFWLAQAHPINAPVADLAVGEAIKALLSLDLSPTAVAGRLAVCQVARLLRVRWPEVPWSFDDDKLDTHQRSLLPTVSAVVADAVESLNIGQISLAARPGSDIMFVVDRPRQSVVVAHKSRCVWKDSVTACIVAPPGHEDILVDTGELGQKDIWLFHNWR
ncbi:hypothetical protein VTJ49DRAFT_5976 [Mycothermus thermophilus]|uniref:Uncharacterized protein n=1 Tax=Humicola insolens TaxID=85995 RepID=A0ABR3V2M9_HUMIN